MPWKNITCLSLLKKVNAGDVIIFEENVLVLGLDQWTQQWANPGYELNRSIAKESDLFESLLEDEICDVHFQVLGQLVRELDQLVNVVLVRLVQRLLHVFVQLQGQAIISVDTIQYDHFLV